MALPRPTTIPVSLLGLVVLVTLATIYSLLTRQRPYAGFPVTTLGEKGIKAWLLPHMSWMFRPLEIRAKGRELSSGSNIYQIATGAGYRIVLPRKFADELRNHKDLDFSTSAARDFHVTQPGFDSMREGLRPDGLMVDVVRVKLTQSLGLVTQDVVEESKFSIDEWFGDHKEWSTFEIKQALLDIVARVSTRVFAGTDLARNKEYIHIAKENTVSLFTGAATLHQIPALLRPIAVWFIPHCRNLRKQVADARRLLASQVRKSQESATQVDQKSSKTADAFRWMMDIAKGRPINFVAGQLMLSMAAIHTTTEMTTRAMMQCCQAPEIVDELRKEIIRVLKEDGWAKTALYKMKLLDSFLSEVSRCYPMGIGGMGRYTKREIELSDGTILPGGSLVMVENDGPGDAEAFPEPEKFDAYRFLKMRERPGEETRHQFVTTTPSNMLFGHGQHACPGRFFASNEIKILFCFLLLQYDWRYEPGYVPPKNVYSEMQITVPPNVQVQCRRRQPEIDLMDPKEVK
ncbi:hypothetical protein M409DRAFT_27648 [Zasmidium cellare ATCC 36951]|uniref:Cytochrome P450 n=1 Tax=Zasmidium cellare ATCC 36951 TaxID=1080233 RepID=A0A6A6C7P4_ZASCE|nr:uncharacterized protein M409DRAFT_27648 [Zasmidium cellare ATCC 36951]KAF2161922.1 hypothetical protein M409DRAFT_27648 [Zasmidium cellare ATCC 36951]